MNAQPAFENINLIAKIREMALNPSEWLHQ